ncbi:hypothetical protein DFQ28_002777 [Apophysomyces sp. BC1034]|nr:hypothetical protein DFQ30_003072 [Apophysomyces sp. BC1015]KAG0179539.1 hypothetical protein DFQ29_001951 [Apophysomyces sp. BC1021]KAG0189892.1 hypothetical protein DFQ28_002777 [Apophysomyces sp. BC1034]
MSEIIHKAPAHYVLNYSTGPMVNDMDHVMSPKPNSPASFENGHRQSYNAYQEYALRQMPVRYPGVPVAYPITNYGYFPEQPKESVQSPESASSKSPSVAQAAATTTLTTATSQQDAVAMTQTPLSTARVVLSHPTSSMVTPLPSAAGSTAERVKETIARANSLPVEFFQTEFHEYSKESYEKKLNSKRNKRKRPSAQLHTDESSSEESTPNKRTRTIAENKNEESDEEQEDVSNSEIRRQIHIQSEQKRRAQIRDGFEELRSHLPGCNNKKMSKATLLTRTVQHMEHLRTMQNELLAEVERLAQENESLKKFQQGILQPQGMDKMYSATF